MTAFDGAREDWEAAAPRPWLAARLLVKVALGIVCGAEVALLLWAALP